MGRTAARTVVTALTIGLLLLGDLAWAEPAPLPIRLPVSMISTPSSGTVVVEEGDHLWKISERRLSDVYQREATNAEIGPYWREIIDENQPTLRSGNPDLIYPGEVVALPPVDG